MRVCVSCESGSFVIQRMAILYTFSRDDGLYSEWGANIRDIFDSDLSAPSQPTL